MSSATCRRIVVAALAALLLALAATASAQAARYVALGDSYSSGVGTRSYDAGSGDCQRSTAYAYPGKVAARMGLPLTFVACSGARTSDVLANQIASVDGATTHVTISIGGNDAGFASVITQCAKPWPTTCWGQIDGAQSFIRDTLPGRLDQVFGEIRRRAPGARVAVVGYPRLFNGEECNLGSRISPGEQERLNETADLLAGTIGGRARAAGFAYVDPRGAFTGHAVCDGVEWINGLSSPIGESYHPNRAGHDGYRDLVAPALGG